MLRGLLFLEEVSAALKIRESKPILQPTSQAIAVSPVHTHNFRLWG